MKIFRIGKSVNTLWQWKHHTRKSLFRKAEEVAEEGKEKWNLRTCRQSSELWKPRFSAWFLRDLILVSRWQQETGRLDGTDRWRSTSWTQPLLSTAILHPPKCALLTWTFALVEWRDTQFQTGHQVIREARATHTQARTRLGFRERAAI